MKDSKDDLLNIIKDSREKSRIIVRQSREIGEYGQYISDFAEASESAVSCVTDSCIDLQPKIKFWKYLNQHLNNVGRGIQKTIDAQYVDVENKTIRL